MNLSGHEIEFLCQEIQYSIKLEKVYLKLNGIKTYDLGVECFEQVMMVTECYLECESESPFLMFTLLYMFGSPGRVLMFSYLTYYTLYCEPRLPPCLRMK